MPSSPVSFLGTFASLSHAFHRAVDVALSEGRRNAGRALPNIELPLLAFALTRPRARLIDIPARKIALPFLMAEFLWQAAQRDDVEMLSAYAPRIGRYSADGRRFAGTAYGARLFGRSASGAEPQWRRALDCLREDPDSRRAVLALVGADEDRSMANRDMTCTFALQFLVRDGRVDMIATMRSNDIMRGLQSDVFFFTMLQEIAALELGLEVGTYTHTANLAQIYQEDREWAERCAADRIRSDGCMRPLASSDIWSDIRAAITCEEEMRSGAPPSRETPPESLRDWIVILKAFLERDRESPRRVDTDWVDVYRSAATCQNL
jgi:thymidylate synthase